MGVWGFGVRRKVCGFKVWWGGWNGGDVGAVMGVMLGDWVGIVSWRKGGGYCTRGRGLRRAGVAWRKGVRGRSLIWKR